ncbi:MAG: phosphoribosyltransferase family protein [Gemmobacter sp.]|nr:phosphoribosyltransferase family protein [Gemmobacter sp.]
MFADRDEAGRELARHLLAMRDQAPVILALPRGGVPVAARIAEALNAPLDLMLVRKIGVPGHRELAVGAIAGPDGQTMVTNPEVAAMAGLDTHDIEQLADAERVELRRRHGLYLNDRAPIDLAGKTVILVDDGIATGATAKAALLALRTAAPKRIVLAVPVASTEAVAALRPFADEIICLAIPQIFHAVGAHYRDFPQVEDAEVIQTLASHRPQVKPSQT